MTAGLSEQAQRRTTPQKLDHATTQAVFELKAAVRALQRLERVSVSQLSPAQRAVHEDRIELAKTARRLARLGLERLLEEDA